MDHSSNEHEGHDDHGGIHLPDPSVWPLVIGGATMLLGLALIYWTRDRNSDIAGPLLGIGIVATLIAAFGWAYEDGRMKAKAEQGEHTKERDARYTQVITFGVAEGMLEQARSTGVIAALEARDSTLMSLDGFQDLRIIASPAETGPSQVLVETTWSNKHGLATYEETSQTILDLLANYPEEVPSGSVQVFDMEVIRDTKDVAFRFSRGAAMTVIGGLLVGGFMVGAGLNLFAHEGTAAGGGNGDGGNGGGEDPFMVVATDNRFDKSELSAAPNIEVTFTLENRGNSPHNLAFYDRQGGTELAPGSIGEILFGGATTQITFTTPGVGSYFFVCDVHPTEMTGTFNVVEGGPGGGSTGGDGDGGTGGEGSDTSSVIATDNKFEPTTLRASANTEVTFTLENRGNTPHNLAFFDRQGGSELAPGSVGEIIFGGATTEVTFTTPGPGSYFFVCEVHPTEMTGTLEVT